MNKAALIKRTREHKDKSFYELLQEKIITEEEYNWLIANQGETSALPTFGEKKGRKVVEPKPDAPLKTMAEVRAEKAANPPAQKPVVVRRIDTFAQPQHNPIVSLKPRHSQPKNFKSTAMAVLRNKQTGKEKPMLRVAAMRMAKSNPNFYEVINK